MRLRRATLDDVPLLVRHRRGMWDDMDEGTIEGRDRQDRAYRRWIRARLGSGAAVAFVAEAGGRPAASGVLWFQPVQPSPFTEKETIPYVLSMYTEPAHRGKGLATRIVKACVALARRRGYARVSLHASSAGRSVYRRLGFERTWEMRRRLRGRAA